MSGLLQGKVYYTDLPAHLRLTLLALADEANDEGRGIYIGQARLARKIGAGGRTVRRNLGELRDLGYIVRLEEPSRYGTDQYELDLRKLPNDRSIWPEGGPANMAAPDNGDIPDRTPVTATTGHPRPPTREIPVSKSTRESFFAAFFDEFPSARKGSRRDVRKAWDKAIRRADPEVILAAARRYRDDPNRTDEFTAGAARWLNRDGWEEGPLPSPNGRRHEGTLDRTFRRAMEGVNDAQQRSPSPSGRAPRALSG